MSDLFSRRPLIIKADNSMGFDKWLKLAREKLPGVHPGRHNEWALSRWALDQQLRSEAGLIAFGKEFDGFHHLRGIPEWTFSLSHSKEWGGAWLVKTQDGLGIGLDIEYKDRKISHEVFQRMNNPDDINIDLVTQWAVKEAAYKSLPKEIQDSLWLNSIKVKRGTFEVRGHSVKGEWTTFPHDQLIVAAAVRLP